MTNYGLQSDFGRRSIEEFKEKLLQELPSLERLMAVIREFCGQKSTVAKTPLPCDSCPKLKDKLCSKPCEALEAYLPRPYAGKIHDEGTIGTDLDDVRNGGGSGNKLEEENVKKLDQGTLKGFQKVVSIDFFAEYEACWHIFSKKQRPVLAAYYRDGKTITEIASELGKAKSTVWGLLHRAERKKREWYTTVRL